MPETDEKIYYRFLLAGDSRDLSVLLARHREALTLFINSYVHNMEDAEELMIDAFAVVAVKKNPFLGQSSFRTWLFSIGKRLALQSLKKKRHSLDELDENLPGGSTPDMELLKDERKNQLYEALSRINPEYRQILILLYFDQMSYEEAGRVMKKTRRQMYNLAERGKKALKEELQRMGCDL